MTTLTGKIKSTRVTKNHKQVFAKIYSQSTKRNLIDNFVEVFYFKNRKKK